MVNTPKIAFFLWYLPLDPNPDPKSATQGTNEKTYLYRGKLGHPVIHPVPAGLVGNSYGSQEFQSTRP